MDKNLKKTREAAALRYSPGENNAPQIIASGKGEIAEKIIESAKENKIPIFEDASLAHALTKLDIGQEIPPELYEVVAEILVFISRLDNHEGDK